MPVTVLRVKVKPNSRTSMLAVAEDGSWLAQLKSPPVDGKANRELIQLVADYFKCPRSAVAIRSGVSARMKTLTIDVR